MKTPSIALGLAFLAFMAMPLSAAPLASQLGLWSLDFYTSSKEAQIGIDARIKKDFLPVSLEVNQDQGLAVFYIKNFGSVRPKTRIDQVPLAKLGPTLNELIKNQWLPQDVCFRGNTTYILSWEDAGSIGVTGAIVESVADVKTIQKDLADWAQKGYVPMGLSIDNNIVYTLALKDNRAPFQEIKISRHPNDGQSAFAEMDRLLDSTWRLMGFATSAHEVYVLYIR